MLRKIIQMTILINSEDEDSGYSYGDDEYLGCVWFSYRMTEYTWKLNEEIVSAFITSTCQSIPKLPLVLADDMHNLLACQSPPLNDYEILCGSYAEFYIDLLFCV